MRYSIANRLFIRAVTLLEMLIATAALVVLTALLLPAITQTLQTSQRAAGAAQLRQIAAAIQNYAADHQGRLPGPLWPGQIPVHDVSRPGRLAVFLATYLGARISSESDVVIVPALAPKGFSRHLPANVALENSRTYVMNMSVKTESGIVNPWGSASDSSSTPMPLTAVTDHTGQWMLSAADQRHPAVSAAPWRAFTPAKSIYGPVRPYLFFDGHVQWLKAD
jgi:type II secretory pathway pseudopilin PulG